QVPGLCAAGRDYARCRQPFSRALASRVTSPPGVACHSTTRICSATTRSSIAERHCRDTPPGSSNMAFSLYAATIPSYQQTLGAIAGLLVTAEKFCAEKQLAPQEIIDARLAEDMLPFAYQVKSTAVHSLGSIEGVRRGVFSPDMTPPPQTFTALK